MRRIAIWNTAFLGDAILTLPLVRALKDAFPQAEADFYVRRGLGDLFRAQPELHAVVECDKRRSGPGELLRLGRDIAARRYDLWIGCHLSPRSSLLALLSRAPIRVGYSGSLLRRLCYTHLVGRDFGRRHEIERLLLLAGPVGAAPDPTPTARPRLILPPALREAAFRNATHPCLGLHPGSVWGTKRWTEEGFAFVAAAALAAGADVVLFAGPGEEAEAARVQDLTLRAALPPGSGRLRNLAGRLSLPELAAAIGALDCYLGNDSGPLHLAWSQGVPVTAIFGPTTEKLGFFPRGEHASVVEIPLPCRPCGLHGPQVCPLGHHRCMKDINPEVVWQDVRRKLFATASPQSTSADSGAARAIA